MDTKFHVIDDDSFFAEKDGLGGGKFCYSVKAIVDNSERQIIISFPSKYPSSTPI